MKMFHKNRNDNIILYFAFIDDDLNMYYTRFVCFGELTKTGLSLSFLIDKHWKIQATEREPRVFVAKKYGCTTC